MLRLLWLAACAGLLSACALPNKAKSVLTKADNPPGYSIAVSGNPALQKELEQELANQRKNNRKLQQFSSRRKIALLESELLTKKLRSEGYYGGKVSYQLNDNRIQFEVESGPLYRISQLGIDWPQASLSPDSLPLTLTEGSVLRAADVIAERKALARHLSNHACLLSINVETDIKVYHDTHSAEVLFKVADSPTVNLGQIAVEGATQVETDYLQERVSIKSGDCFRRQNVDQARLELLQTNLISSVNTRISEPIDGKVDVTFEVLERQHKTFSAGVVYQTDEGTGLGLGWEHRNLFGRAEKLAIDSLFSESSRYVDTSITLPHFRKPNQVLRLSATIENEFTDAFESDVGRVMAELSKQMSLHLRGSVATALDFSHVTENEQKNNFALVSTPLTLEYDKRNDPLDPRTGWIASVKTTPYIDMYEESRRFLKSIFSTSAYLSSNSLPLRPTLAARTALGTISGIEREDVPANIRFFIGGGGSVRGYAYQTVGPITEGEPQGGLSFHESSLETRLRFGENWGGVVFIEGGMAYEQEKPQVSERFLWAAGLGVRYYTNFAPIRFDLAFPLDKRPGVDDDFQLYISIGQAF